MPQKRRAWSHYYANANPKTILGSNLLLWLRADLGISIGTGVSAWADQSGNGNNFVQATGANQPTYFASGGGNGQAYLSSPAAATNVTMVCAGWASLAQPFEDFLVINRTAISGSNNEYLTDFGAGIVDNTVGAVNSATLGIATSIPGPTIAITAGVDVIVDSKFNGASSSIALNNGTPSTGNGGTAATGVGATIFNYVGGGNSWNGRIYERVLSNVILTASQRTALTRYFGARYGITVP